jgi:hypothetical protein
VYEIDAGGQIPFQSGQDHIEIIVSAERFGRRDRAQAFSSATVDVEL